MILGLDTVKYPPVGSRRWGFRVSHHVVGARNPAHADEEELRKVIEPVELFAQIHSPGPRGSVPFPFGLVFPLGRKPGSAAIGPHNPSSRCPGPEPRIPPEPWTARLRSTQSGLSVSRWRCTRVLLATPPAPLRARRPVPSPHGADQTQHPGVTSARRNPKYRNPGRRPRGDGR